MKTLYSKHNHSRGLPFWTGEQIQLRNFIKQGLIFGIEKIFRKVNGAWNFVEIEAPILTPKDLVNEEYREPSYSLRTLDIEVRTHVDKWLEVCSISERKHDAYTWLEIAFGLDRLILI